MPYGFYTLVRFVAVISFCFFAYQAYKSENEGQMVLFIALAILFQPFVKLPLGRVVWNVVDVIVAVYLFYLLIKYNKEEI